MGTVFGSLIIGYARNPSLKQQLFSYAILGFALSEALGSLLFDGCFPHPLCSLSYSPMRHTPFKIQLTICIATVSPTQIVGNRVCAFYRAWMLESIVMMVPIFILLCTPDSN